MSNASTSALIVELVEQHRALDRVYASLEFKTT